MKENDSMEFVLETLNGDLFLKSKVPHTCFDVYDCHHNKIKEDSDTVYINGCERDELRKFTIHMKRKEIDLKEFLKKEKQ